MAEEDRRRPYMFWQSGTEFIGCWCVTNGPGEEDGRGKRPSGGMAGVPQGRGLGVPTAPSADAAEGSTTEEEGGGPHATEAVPGEGTPWGIRQEAMEGVLKGLLGGGVGCASSGGWGGKGGQVGCPARRPEARGGGDPSLGHLFIVKGEGGGCDIRGADAGCLANAEEVSKGEEGETSGVGVRDGLHILGQRDKEVRGGPELRRRWCSQAGEGFGKCPVEGTDCGGKEAKGLQLSDGRDEATGTGGGARTGDHVMEGGCESITMGEMGVLGMVDGQRGKVAEVGVCGTTGPGASGSSKGVSGRGSASCFAELLTQEGKIVGGNGRVGGFGRGCSGGLRVMGTKGWGRGTGKGREGGSIEV